MSTLETHLSHPKYRSDIDGLRAIAVLAVVAFHAFPDTIQGGFIGVDIFFVISGFLISTIIFENLERGTFNFYEFYARRIKRIFPALILVFVSCLIFGWFELLAEEYKQLGKHVAAGSVFISNIVFWNEAGYFDNSAETKPLLHLWSLGIEEQFYIIWPLLIWFAWKRKFNLLTISLVVCAISFLLNIKGVLIDPVATFYLPQTRFWELLSGTLLAWYSLHRRGVNSSRVAKIDGFVYQFFNVEKVKVPSNLFSNIFSFFGILLLICGIMLMNKELSFPGKWALVPVLGTLMILIGGSATWVNRFILSNKIAVWFGLISFPLYLWHWPLLSFARILEGDVPSLEIRFYIVLLSVLLAWLTYKIVELPIRFGNQSNKKVLVLVLLMSTLGGIGFYAYQRDGLSFRLKNITPEKILIKRKGLDTLLASLAWYQGKDNWLFLGDNFQKSVSKLTLKIKPKESRIDATEREFSELAKAGFANNIKVILVIGPNKESIYPEFLPDNVIPSPQKYSSFFLDRIHKIPNLIVYDPTEDLIQAKKNEGYLYYKTDTHWNNKGAFITFSGFSKLLGTPLPKLDLIQSASPFSGDLLEMTNQKDFPLNVDDSWDVVWKNKSIISETEIPNEKLTIFGPTTVVINENAISDKYVWVCGDSFSRTLRQFLNATYREVRYVGHWSDKLKSMPEELSKTERKPDIIIVEKVERSF